MGDLRRIEESIDRNAFKERWREFLPRKKTRIFMRKASMGYNATLRRAERI